MIESFNAASFVLGILTGGFLLFLWCLLGANRPKGKAPNPRRCWYAQRGRWTQDKGRAGRWGMTHQPPEVVQGEHPADYIARHIRGEG